jgi:hypothetical protein
MRSVPRLMALDRPTYLEEDDDQTMDSCSSKKEEDAGQTKDSHSTHKNLVVYRVERSRSSTSFDPLNKLVCYQNYLSLTQK